MRVVYFIHIFVPSIHIMLHIELVPAEIKHIAEELVKITTVIKADLQSNTVKTAEAYAATIVPEIDPLYREILALVDVALKTCLVIQAYDWDGVESRLARLVANITSVKQGKQTAFGKLCTECQIVIDFVLGK